MRVLVTGGAGFIGSHITQHLLDSGHQVLVVDNLSMGRPEHVPPRANFCPRSVLDPNLAGTFSGIDAVVHAAAQTSVAASVAAPCVDASANVVGTAHVMEAAARAGVRRIIYLSSAAVYGTPISLPITEDHPVHPTSPYGLSKLTGEQYVRMLGNQAAMEWVCLRLANVYGPRQNAGGEAGVVARWCASLVAGQSLSVHGDGGQTRDFIHVSDVAAAVLLALERPACSRQVLNVGTSLAVSIGNLLTMLEQVTGRVARVMRTPPRPGDIRHSRLDNRAARRLLNWEPRMELRNGLSDTAAWMKTNGVA